MISLMMLMIRLAVTLVAGLMIVAALYVWALVVFLGIVVVQELF